MFEVDAIPKSHFKSEYSNIYIASRCSVILKAHPANKLYYDTKRDFILQNKIVLGRYILK